MGAAASSPHPDTRLILLPPQAQRLSLTRAEMKALISEEPVSPLLQREATFEEPVSPLFQQEEQAAMKNDIKKNSGAHTPETAEVGDQWGLPVVLQINEK